MMEHVHDQLAYYRDLAPAERRAVDAHLAACAQCRATLDAYYHQDVALASIRPLHPRQRRSPPGRPEPHSGWTPRLVVARVGDVLALGGMAALIWLFALQVQVVSQGGPATLTPAALQPGITLPPTHIQPPSPWLPALPWLAAALLGVGVLFIFTRRSLFPTVVGALASGALLISFVAPFSALPNPVGLYWRAMGGYSYDPRLPFRNSFILADDPAQTLEPRLDQLIGQVGLAPLDPNQPLAGYEILRVGLHPTRTRTVLVTTRFIYADGSSRVYPVPLFSPAVDFGGFWLAAWREDGLERLRSQHLAFPAQPFATDRSPIQIGRAQRLDLHPEANRLDEANPAHWLWNSVRVDRLSVAPDGSAFLVAIEKDAGLRQLWLVPLDGGPPVAIGPAGDVREYGWSPDSGYIVATRFDPQASAVDSTHPFAVDVVAREAASTSRLDRGYTSTTLVTGLGPDQLPGLTGQGVWFVSNNHVWLAPYTGGQPEQLPIQAFAPQLVRPAPDGARLAYICGIALCLTDTDGAHPARLDDLRPAEMEWSPDGARLAVVDRDRNNLRPVRLVVVSRAGDVLWSVAIAPRDVTDPPEWTPDGAAVFVQTFPQDGRRIIAVDAAAASHPVIDLSQEHWDAYFALMPDGRRLLLNNGRGDFWLAEVIRKPE